jgi:hypothetical protein
MFNPLGPVYQKCRSILRSNAIKPGKTTIPATNRLFLSRLDLASTLAMLEVRRKRMTMPWSLFLGLGSFANSVDSPSGCGRRIGAFPASSRNANWVHSTLFERGKD